MHRETFLSILEKEHSSITQFCVILKLEICNGANPAKLLDNAKTINLNN